MIQLNLLPDVKQQFIKTRRTRRLITLISFVVSGASLAVMLILLLTVNVWQKGKVDDLKKDIETSLNELKDTEDIGKILTIQNQLNALNSSSDEQGNLLSEGLHDQKSATVRMFDYLQQVLPQGVFVSDIELNFEDSTFNISGTTDTLERANKFVDTLKFTEYIADGNEEEKALAFSGVVFSQQRSDDSTTFNVMGVFDPVIFDTNVDIVQLIVQNITTTRSELELPGTLFKAQLPTEGEN